MYHLVHQGHPVLIPQGQGHHLQTGPGRGKVICMALDAEEAGRFFVLLGNSVIKCRSVSYLKFPRRTFLTDFNVEKKNN